VGKAGSCAATLPQIRNGTKLAEQFERPPGLACSTKSASSWTRRPGCRWGADVIDADPAARDKTVKVKLVAQVQPVLLPAAGGMPFLAVGSPG
jgi:hypothetical protein